MLIIISYCDSIFLLFCIIQIFHANLSSRAAFILLIFVKNFYFLSPIPLSNFSPHFSLFFSHHILNFMTQLFLHFLSPRSLFTFSLYCLSLCCPLRSPSFISIHVSSAFSLQIFISIVLLTHSIFSLHIFLHFPDLLSPFRLSIFLFYFLFILSTLFSQPMFSIYFIDTCKS